MKFISGLSFTVVLGIVACGPTPKGVGFTGVGSEPNIMQLQSVSHTELTFTPSANETVTRRRFANGAMTETYTYGGTRTWRASDLAYQPRFVGQVPTVSVSSSSLKRKGSPLHGQRAAYAVAWMAAAKTPGVSVALDGVSGVLRHVKLDGQDFGVVDNVKTEKPSPNWKWSGVEAKLSRIAMTEISCAAQKNIKPQKIDRGFSFSFVLPLNCL